MIIVTNVTYASDLPTNFSNEQYVSRVDDQKYTNWCVAYAVTNAIESQMRSQGLEVPDGGFSKAWLYAKCKEVDNIPYNKGTTVYIALKIAMEYGLCPDYLCPTEKYVNRNTLPKLTEEMDIEASKYKIYDFDLINLDEVKQEIVNGKFVIILSEADRSNWYSRKGLILPTLAKPMFYHTTYLIGYNDLQKIHKFKGFYYGINSWGLNWGYKGMYSMSYDYFNTNKIKQAWIVEIR